MSKKLRSTQRELEKVERELHYRNKQFKSLKNTAKDHWQEVLRLRDDAKQTRLEKFIWFCIKTIDKKLSQLSQNSQKQ
jgi:hypothetical protein